MVVTVLDSESNLVAQFSVDFIDELEREAKKRIDNGSIQKDCIFRFGKDQWAFVHDPMGDLKFKKIEALNVDAMLEDKSVSQEHNEINLAPEPQTKSWLILARYGVCFILGAIVMYMLPTGIFDNDREKIEYCKTVCESQSQLPESIMYKSISITKDNQYGVVMYSEKEQQYGTRYHRYIVVEFSEFLSFDLE